VRIATSKPADCVVVADSGRGIAPDERELVLRAFHRTLGSDQLSSGLGLAFVKAIADRNRAQLRLDYTDSKKESGLRATVSIPLAASLA
jgi:two-component system OmpR family sensor kinase